MFKLKQYFLWVGGAAFLIFTTGFFYLLYAFEQDMLRQSGERENVTVAAFLRDVLIDDINAYVKTDFKTHNLKPLERTEVQKIDLLIGEFSKKYPILKVKLFNLEGLTLYSSITSEIGIQKEWNKGLESASIHKKPFSEMNLKNEMATLTGVIYNRDIVETYLPVYSNENQVIAIFELYTDVTDLVIASKKRLKQFAGTLLFGYLLLFGIFYLIVNYASKIISRQYHQLNESNRLLEDTKVTLEDTVKDRTEELSDTVKRLEKEVNFHAITEQELKKLSVAMEQSPTALLITDTAGNIEYINPMFSKITGYSANEVIGKHTRILGSGNTHQKLFTDLWHTINAGGTWKGEMLNSKKNGELFLQSTTIAPIKDRNEKIISYMSLSEDITRQKENEKRIHHLAHHDALTGLFNRFSLEDRLDQMVNYAGRSNEKLAVLFLDLDRFKVINDSLGHKAGDELLKQVAERLKQACRRESDIVARIGGDEFVLVLLGLPDPMFAGHIAKTIINSLSSPYEYLDNELLTSPSIGVSIFPDDGDCAELLLKNADTAMYHAKDMGRGNYQFFTNEMNLKIEERVALEKGLYKGIAENQFRLVYQPKICLEKNMVCGVEALLRWQHPEQGFISPEKFIPVAEDCNLITYIGQWVIDTALSQLEAWHKKGLNQLHMAINVSAKQLEDADFIPKTRELLNKYDIDSSFVEFEITESAAMKDPDNAIDLLLSLRSLGITLAIDDFGTGYSSLSYLKMLPVQSLKLDRSFVMNLENDENNAAISQATISLAHDLGFNVVAEGVETKNQAEFLEEHGCDMLQGYFFSKPVSSEEIEEYIDSKSLLPSEAN